jgi:hypothetical protein
MLYKISRIKSLINSYKNMCACKNIESLHGCFYAVQEPI